MSNFAKPRVCVVGAGPAGLMAAETLARAGAETRIIDRMPSPGRKFLMAGRGGLNLTHSEPMDRLLARYGPAAERMRPILAAFGPDELRRWSAGLGEPTFVGSSGRVFPHSFKASPLLRAWLRRLDDLGARLQVRREFVRLLPDLQMETRGPTGRESSRFDSVVLALGGATWPRLGSDGSWAMGLAESGVALAPFRPANCGFDVAWSAFFRTRHAGAPLKGAAFSFGAHRVRGEATITDSGLEGGAIYTLSAALRDETEARGSAVLLVDLRPDISEAELAKRIALARGKDSWSQKMRKAAGLSPVAIALLREAATSDGQVDAPACDAAELAARVKRLPILLLRPASLERAISSAGGVRFEELDADLMLRRQPGVFVCGEMLDFEAPTGGYLLQAAFSTGFVAGRGAARRLGLTPLREGGAPKPEPEL